MGTRHLIAVHKDGKYPIAQYGQWDGYPTGQGVRVLAFCQDAGKLQRLEANLGLLHEVTKAEWDAINEKAGIPEGTEWINMAQVAARKQLAPQMDRDLSAGILDMVADRAGSPMAVQNALKFAADSLFCEWAYVIHFDTRQREAYQGFNTAPLPEGARFASLETKGERANGETYYPVKLIKAWPLDALPDRERFLAEIKEALGEEDEEAC